MLNCPNCGQPTKRTEDWACFLCGYPLLSRSYRKIPKTYKQLKEERSHEQLSRLTEDTASPKIELSFEELFSIFTSDQVEADTRFKNKILSVTGAVAKIVVDYDGDIYYVSLTGAQKNAEYNVNCIFDKNNSSQLTVLTDGQKVTIVGKYDSYEMNILIKDCFLVSLPPTMEPPASPVTNDISLRPTHTLESEEKSAPEPEIEPEPTPELAPVTEPASKLITEPARVIEPELDLTSEPEPIEEPEPELPPEPEPDLPALEVSVDELLASYATDEAVTDVKFGGKILNITGIVNRIEVKDYLDLDYIYLTSAENTILDHVRCFFNKQHGPELNQLTKGQKVTVQGTYHGSIVNMRLLGCILVYKNK
ncbi:hypothetical protein ACFLTL_02015 [Chloroflexota bacterium]